MKYTRGLFSALIIASILLQSGCSGKPSVALNEIKYVSEDDPWYDTIVIEDDPEDIGCYISYSDVKVTREDYFVEYVTGMPHGELISSCDVLYKYDYSGNLLGRLDVDEAINSENVRCMLCGAYTYNDVDYYVFLKEEIDYDTWIYTHSYLVCTIDYDTGELTQMDEKTFEEVFPGDITVSDVAVSGDYVVYLLLSHNEYAFYVENLVDGTNYYGLFNPGTEHAYYSFDICKRENVPSDGPIYYTVFYERDCVHYSFDPVTGRYEEVGNANSNFCYYLHDGTKLVADGGVVYKEDVVTGERLETVFDSKYSAIATTCANHIDFACYNGENLVIRGDLTSNVTGVQAMKYYIVTETDTNPHAGKQIVTMGYSGFFEPNVARMVENNNRDHNSQYFIEVVDTYHVSFAEGTYYESVARSNDLFINDVRSGNGPDIMLGGDSFSVAVPGLVYIDLNDYIASSDSINREDFANVVFDAYEIDGHIYTLPYGVNMTGLSAKLAKLDISGFTYDEYINHANIHNYGRDVLNTYINYGENADLSDLEYFDSLFALCFQDFMTDGHFNITDGIYGEEFRSLVEFVDSRDSAYNAESGETIALIHQTSYAFLYYVNSCDSNVRNYIGYPSYDGTSTCFSDATQTIAITTCCADKDAAWSVLSQMFSYEIQSYPVDFYIPVRLDALSDYCDVQIEGIEERPEDFYIDWDVTQVDLNEYKAEFMYLIQNMNTARYCDPMVMVIISEELPAYFEGQKSLDDVAGIIQNRVNNYIDEISN